MVMKYLLLKENLAKQNSSNMLVTLGDKHPSNSEVNKWVARFTTGHLTTEGKECSGRRTQVTVPKT
jgi:hypothetical protein